MEIIRDFGIQPILLLAQIVNFAILLFILNKLIYKPILKILEERKERIKNSEKLAEEIEKRFALLTKEQEKILNQAKAEANKIISEAKSEAQLLSEQIKEEAKETAEIIMKRNHQLIESEKQKMVKEAKRDIVDLAILITEKVLSENLTAKDKQKITAKIVKEIKN